MLIQIKVTLITENGKHTVFLPQTQSDFDNTLTRMHIINGDMQEYRICYVSCNLENLNRLIFSANDIEELNFLAQLLEGLSDREIRTFERFFNPRMMSITIQSLINIAYSFYQFSFDYYDGRLFPSFDYEINYTLRITLSKYNQHKGIDIILPATDSVIKRALFRLGAHCIEECEIIKYASWNFDALENMVISGEEISELNELMRKLIKLPRYELAANLEILSETDRTITISDLKNLANADNFILEPMRA